uniref:Coiled-coil domain containing 138 n=1 Tax=Molossus molossus TaxID=27622 RepID=A0A7J8F6R7_MOLMO|nr:coiled-coil domain containing 138 [Molossus molossus]
MASNSRNWTECCSDAGDPPLKRVSCPTSNASEKQSLLPHQINQIYDELFQIHQKLQCETAAQQEFAEELQRRERYLLEREQLLFRHETALSKMRGVEEEVLTRFRVMKEQHDAEVVHLTEVLKEKNKESKRLRSSFDTLKELNDSLKKQLNDMSEENKKMEIQAKRVQARLDNLQRKYAFMTVQRLKANSHAAHETKSLKQEKVPASKTYKVPPNAQVYELLTVFMDWISDYHLRRLRSEEPGTDGEKLQLQLASQRNEIQERCVKLPALASSPAVCFCSRPELLISLLRKLQELFRSSSATRFQVLASQPQPWWLLWSLHYNLMMATKSLAPAHDDRAAAVDAVCERQAARALREVHLLVSAAAGGRRAADYLAQAFDSLCLDLKTDEGKILFLEYQAVPVILSHLRISSKGLLPNVIDSLLQMTVESKSLQPFLDACSNTLFFRTCSVLLRAPKLDLQILEKLSIILQKLSKIKSNKKLFELFTLHLMLQEIQRTTHPEHAFLCINLNSTLFNLGLTKCGPLAPAAGH